jgi:ankyrin repeat protein
MPRRLALALALAALAAPQLAAAQTADNANSQALAIASNNLEAASATIGSRADADRTLPYGESALARAVYGQSPEMVALLLKKGARPDQADAYGVTPLALACELGNEAITALLLDARAKVRLAGPDGATPLALCARFSGVEAVRRVLKMGAVADSVDARGQSPLMWAAEAGKADTMQVLLDAGADPARLTKAGFTPLFFAIKSGKQAPVRLLLDKGIATSHRGPENTSALQLALYQSNYAAAALLVERGGADLAERDRQGLQPLHRAAAAGDAGLVRLLLDKGADANGLSGPSRITWVTEANFGMPPPPVPPTPPLFSAAAKGQAATMRLLIEAGAKSGFVAENGKNVVHSAISGGKLEALELALTLAPDANFADAQGNSPLMALLFSDPSPEFEPMLRLLASKGASADLANTKGLTPRQIAATGLTESKALFEQAFPHSGKVAPINLNRID